ncbi:major histocompatibility complex class I-related gene protein-like isoform X3 [Pituophis catenifer annectens]|uniref:major histocompatibility complex class I-related gene protein-like isoform X3 n=1 Tax=Pituophis catenifer annectens TaxID=94852 RepID=UPI0039968A59
MQLKWVSSLLLGTVLWACHGSLSHSLCYFYLQLPEPSQGQPQSFVTGYFDDQPIARYDSLTRKTEPLVPWMEEVEKETFLPLEWVFRADLEKVSKLDRCAGEPPVGKVNCKIVDDRLEVLTCQAFGFYPKEIQAIWTREGEACVYETLHRNVVPNSDGTYYVHLSIEIDPKERDRFRCHLEHEGLQEPLVLALEEETGWQIPVGIGAIIILGAAILFRICWWWRCWKKLHQEKKTYPGDVPPEMDPSPSSTEDEFLPKRYSNRYRNRDGPQGQRRKEAQAGTDRERASSLKCRH